MKKTVFLLLGLSAIVACKKSDSPPQPYGNGVYVLNQGNFTHSNGSLSYYDRSTGTVSVDPFQQVNGRSLGDVVESATLFNGKIYIVVNNSSKVEVADAATLKSTGVINGFNIPYYLKPISDSKAYVTEYNNYADTGTVAIVDLNNLTITGHITVEQGAEDIVLVGNYAYVTSALNDDNLVNVIDTRTDQLVTKITVGDNTDGIEVDAAGKVWVLYSGAYSGTPGGGLARINPATNAVEVNYPLASLGTPGNLTIDGTGQNLYFQVNGTSVYRFATTGTTAQPLLVHSATVYGLGVDPKTNILYTAIAPGFTSAGYVLRYDASKNALLDSFSVGIGPGNFAFTQ